MRCSSRRPERVFQIKRAMQAGLTNDELYSLTAIDPWFLQQMRELLSAESWYAELEGAVGAGYPDDEAHGLQRPAARRAAR